MAAKKALISYSHKDEVYRAALVSALANLVRNGALELWSDHQILPGQHIDDQIMSQLKEADVVLLLVSPDFIASDYCFKRELQIALERHGNGRAAVVPILIRPTDWSDAPFAHLMMLPLDARPVSSWPDSDEAWLNVAQALRRLISQANPEHSTHTTVKTKGIDAHLRDAFDQLQQRYEDPSATKAMSFGFSLESLDHLTDGVWPGECMLIASRPDHGHIELALSAVTDAALKGKKKILVISQRLPATQFANRAMCLVGRVSRSKFARSLLDDDDWSRITASIRLLRSADITIDDDPVRSHAELRVKLSEISAQEFDVVLFDGIEYANCGAEERAIALTISDFARQQRVAVIATFTLGAEIEMRAYRKPMLADLGDWQVAESLLSKILFCFRAAAPWIGGATEELSHVVEASLVKSQDGVVGTIELTYFDEYGIVNGPTKETN